MKILVVEDEPSLRELIQKSLEKERFVVEVAPDLFSAIDKVEVYDYMDITLNLKEKGRFYRFGTCYRIFHL